MDWSNCVRKIIKMVSTFHHTSSKKNTKEHSQNYIHKQQIFDSIHSIFKSGTSMREILSEIAREIYYLFELKHFCSCFIGLGLYYLLPAVVSSRRASQLVADSSAVHVIFW